MGRAAVGMPVLVVIADGDAATRFGIRSLLTGDGMEVCADVATADAAVAAVTRHRPAVCIIDLALPGGGLAAAERIRAEAAATAVIFLADSTSRDDVVAAARVGARGYLLKDTDPARLPAAIRGVAHGESAFPRTLVPHLLLAVASGPRRGVAGPLAALSEREHEVMEALAAGLNTSAVAARLSITDTTVRRHAAAAAAKLGAATRDEAIRRFIELGVPRTE
jgi:DNA-binding NarL/FixJ family response regulator